MMLLSAGLASLVASWSVTLLSMYLDYVPVKKNLKGIESGFDDEGLIKVSTNSN